jgi:hypothetical protein
LRPFPATKRDANRSVNESLLQPLLEQHARRLCPIYAADQGSLLTMSKWTSESPTLLVRSECA